MMVTQRAYDYLAVRSDDGRPLGYIERINGHYVITSATARALGLSGPLVYNTAEEAIQVIKERT